jgi:hypothetical protein
MTRILALASITLVVAGCGGGLPDVVSDTGYQGTWQRGNERVKSTISIVEVRGEYLFRWSKTSADGKVKVNCTWDGPCQEFVDGEKTSDYTFRAWKDPESGHLRVECHGKVYRPTPLDVYYVDELIARKGKNGLVLRSHTIEDAHGTYEIGSGPRRDFTKVSDYVAEPPEGWSPPGS